LDDALPIFDYRVDLVGRDRLTDHVLDGRNTPLRFLDPRARRATDVEAKLARIDAGKEVHADQPEEAEGERHEAREHPGDDPAVTKGPCEQRGIPLPQTLEASVERPVHGPDRTRVRDGLCGARGVEVRLGRQEVAP